MSESVEYHLQSDAREVSTLRQGIVGQVMRELLDQYFMENDARIRHEFEIMDRLRNRRGRQYRKHRLFKKKFKQALAAESL